MATRNSESVTRGESVDLTIDGQSVTAFKGETIATVLLLQGKQACYRTRENRPRMMFCNMGTCFECRVRVTQASVSRWVLACTTPVSQQMHIETDINLSQWMPGGGSNV